MNVLVMAAVLPVVLLCYYVYKKDVNREPLNLLTKIFGFGALACIPILIVELFLDTYFNVDNSYDFITIFIGIFISVAIVEEGFKWLVVKKFGYDNREFDEVYDIIVYSVFASLGFACVENILYVTSNGLSNALFRGVLAVPGHTCFGIMMGYFLSKAKIADISGNSSIKAKNIILSIILPTLLHTTYDALIIYFVSTQILLVFEIFIIFDIIMVIVCFITVNRISHVQMRLNSSIKQGNIINNDGRVQLNENISNINYCPICGNKVLGCNFCGRCGFRVK